VQENGRMSSCLCSSKEDVLDAASRAVIDAKGAANSSHVCCFV
jgi:hypothetical protein